MMRDFLPISRDDMKKRGWDELDFVYVIGSEKDSRQIDRGTADRA